MKTARMMSSELKYQQLSYWRNPLGAFFTFFMPVMFLVIFGSLYNNQKAPSVLDAGGAISFDQYFVPAILTLGVISACYTQLAIQLSNQRDAGLLKRVRSSPLPPAAYLFTVVLSCLIRTAVLVGITLAVGGLFYGLVFPAHAALALVVVVGIASVTFSAIGIAITAAIPNADAAPAIVNGIYLPLMFISGTFFPLSSSSILTKIASYFPVRPFVQASFAALNPLVHGSGIEWHEVGAMVIWCALALVVGVRCFRWTPARKG
ncbi:MAG: ABC transporter permease [Acidimicrobiales bacterium]